MGLTDCIFGKHSFFLQPLHTMIEGGSEGSQHGTRQGVWAEVLGNDCRGQGVRGWAVLQSISCPILFVKATALSHTATRDLGGGRRAGK